VEAYETEEQQVEAIKKWWRENYKSVAAAFILGIGSILGVQFYQQNKLMTSEAASNNYEATLSAALNNQADVISGRTEILKKEFQGTLYASQAALIYAKSLADKGELQAAIEQLQWVRNNTTDVTFKQIAIIQNAQLLAANEKKEQAIQLLNSGSVEEQSVFKPIRMEVKGDILAPFRKDTHLRRYIF